MNLKYSKEVINPIGRLINGQFIKIYRPELNIKQKALKLIGRDFVCVRLSSGEYRIYLVSCDCKGYYVYHLNVRHYLIDEGQFNSCTSAISDVIVWEPI